MRLVLVSHSATAGGAELALLELAEGLRSRGVEVYAVLPGDGALRARLDAVGVETSLERRLPGWVRPAGEPRHRLARHAVAHALAVLSLVRTLRRLRPDAVVTNTLTIPAPSFAARLLGIPHVWCVHEFGDRDHGFGFDLGRERTLRLIGALSRRVVVNSLAVEAGLRPFVPAGRLRLVRYTVSVAAPPSKRTAPNGRLRTVLVGRKVPGKGQEEAIRALAMLKAAGEPVELRLVGGGDAGYVAVLEELARDLGVADKVAFVPETGDPFAHFAWADVALVCSRAEAFGRVTVEAMKLGCPVVGARAAGTAELIRDGWNGVLYESGDPSDLAAKIALLRARPELAERLAATARTWAGERFSSERHAHDFLAVLGEAIGA